MVKFKIPILVPTPVNFDTSHRYNSSEIKSYEYILFIKGVLRIIILYFRIFFI